jgi:hypothetical protein
MTIRFFAAALLLVLGSATLRAAEPAPLPPAVGLSGSAAKERAALFTELAAAKSDAEAREIEERLWTFWRSLADDESRQLLEQSREAQLRFDYAEALMDNKAVVKHAPQFAEGWNQLGYVISWQDNTTPRSMPSTACSNSSRCTTRHWPAKASFCTTRAKSRKRRRRSSARWRSIRG